MWTQRPSSINVKHYEISIKLPYAETYHAWSVCVCVTICGAWLANGQLRFNVLNSVHAHYLDDLDGFLSVSFHPRTGSTDQTE